MRKNFLFCLAIFAAMLLSACSWAGTPTPAATPQLADQNILVWHRSGGIAGFCDDLTISADGSYRISSCASASETPRNGQLSDDQLKQLNNWLATLAPINYQHTDPATADAMTVTLSLASKGITPADETTLRAIFDFVSDIATRP